MTTAVSIPIDACICEGKVTKPRRNCWANTHNLKGAKVEEVNASGLTFAQWYANANRICVRAAGLTLDDLGDGPSRDMWHDDVPPREYVMEILEEEGFPFDA